MKFITGEYPNTIEVCQKVLTMAGEGKYPYNCPDQDKYPNAMIYYGDGCWDALQRSDSK